MKKQILTMRGCSYNSANNKMYFFSFGMNLLCAMDIATKEIEILGSIPGRGINEDELISKVEYLDNKLVLVPCNEEKLWVYDLNSGEWTSYEIPKAISTEKFFSSEVYGTKVYMFGYNNNPVVSFDIKSGEVDNNKHISEKIKGDSVKLHGHVRVDNTVYITTERKNGILKLNMETGAFEWTIIDLESREYAGITYTGSSFVLAGRFGGCPVEWDGGKQFRIMNEVTIVPQKENSYIGAFCTNNEIIFPGTNSETLILNKENFSKARLDEKYYIFWQDLGQGNYVNQELNGKMTIFISGKENSFDVEVPYKLISDYIKNGISSKSFTICTDVMYENPTWGFDLMLDALLAQDDIVNDEDEISIGEKIYNTVIESL